MDALFMDFIQMVFSHCSLYELFGPFIRYCYVNNTQFTSLDHGYEILTFHNFLLGTICVHLVLSGYPFPVLSTQCSLFPFCKAGVIRFLTFFSDHTVPLHHEGKMQTKSLLKFCCQELESSGASLYSGQTVCFC